MRSSLVASFLLLLVAAPATLIACSEDEDKTAPGPSEEEIRARKGGEGARCIEQSDCQNGLVCKNRPSGPPPGAVGMPLPAEHASSGPPPGAMGMPVPRTTCQKPAEGEVGSRCTSDESCNDGLECEFGHATGGGPPPGAMGMPILHGTCKEKSSGPPPGAVGLPIHN